MFTITQGKGFHIKFANGYTASVQFGPGNYCNNKYAEPFDRTKFNNTSEDAEIALFDPQGNFVRLSTYDDVMGHCTPEEVITFLHNAATNPEALRVPKEDY